MGLSTLWLPQSSCEEGVGELGSRASTLLLPVGGERGRPTDSFRSSLRASSLSHSPLFSPARKLRTSPLHIWCTHWGGGLWGGLSYSGPPWSRTGRSSAGRTECRLGRR